uniref:Cupiennin-5a n=1 Tax=Cupiennius salei TaxID=6928 RepID=TXC5A_CUPSA|nr:RecName: Full=Cupiennin-5a; Short=Cu-5a; AltName: Full=Short cationic peptide-7a; Short=SCP-7a [Cupiennius salei]
KFGKVLKFLAKTLAKHLAKKQAQS